jgi:hypothetical protein
MTKKASFSVAGLALLLFAARSASADFVYDFHNYAALQQGYTLSGTITTDINSGWLAPGYFTGSAIGDITAWTIVLKPASGPAVTYVSTNPGTFIQILGTV